MTQWESLNERNAFVLLDCDTRVRTYKEQPAVIQYEVAGRSFRHFPDVWVQYESHQEFLEIKPAKQAQDPEVQVRTALMEEELPRFGYRYRLLLAEDLALQPRLKTCSYLARYGRQPIHAHAREWARRMFAQEGHLCWNDIQGGALGARGVALACRLVLEGSVTLDLDKELGASTVLHWSADSKGSR
ncbi:TnsA endonuclease N-terminal domain-containing protein [Curvibacter sp. PAE-UM]|uniref:TnsA endonuclease N-terminal domain-containing protein n=1 Tax=Curvibacter sp. PAE-UM TaxID=1714344 RepID=UPI0012E3373B|nr:TnsA endonuclease N-terminal domain-containing protein [Curvibacter sp. PAE-UM]